MPADRKPKPFTLYTEQKNGRVTSTDYETATLAVVAAKTARAAGGYSHIFIRQYATEAGAPAKTIWEWKA